MPERKLKRRKKQPKKQSNIIQFPTMRKAAIEFNEKLKASGEEIPVPIYTGDVGGYLIKDVFLHFLDFLWDLDFFDPNFKKGFQRALEELFYLDKNHKIIGKCIPENVERRHLA